MASVVKKHNWTPIKLCFCLFLKTGSHYVALADLELQDPPASAPPMLLTTSQCEMRNESETGKMVVLHHT